MADFFSELPMLLSKEAIAVLMRMPRLGNFVFSLSGTKPFQGFSDACQLDSFFLRLPGTVTVCRHDTTTPIAVAGDYSA